MKTIKLILLTILLLVSINSFSQPQRIGTSNTYWELLVNDGDTTLKITGSGDMPDFFTHIDLPWNGISLTFKFLEIGDSITKIGDNTFFGCSGLTGTLTLPKSLRFIGRRAFYACSGLSGQLIFPDNLTTIESFAFNKCNGLTTLHLPDSLTFIGNYAFGECSGLTSVSFSDDLETIGEYAFWRCSGLTSLSLSAGLVFLEAGAFFECSGLTTVSLPAGLASIAGKVFKSCSELTEIINLNPTPVSIDPTVFEGVNKSICVLKVLSASLNFYQQAPVWKDFLIKGIFSVIALSNDTLQGIVNDNISNQVYYIAGDTVTLEATPNADYQFENWTSNGVIISTDNPFSFTVIQDTVITANFNDGVSIHEINNQSDLDKILIYPNPVKERIYIQSFSQVEQITIYSISGKILKKINGRQASLPVSDLVSGMYLIKVKMENEETVWKIIKE
ncbi:MAG: leucine-rich repeat protein [Bacteroidales bacterium]|jgi:hypothetical protein|nr:leucine-rich repeat protein [Bacteroidales bacterium]